MDEFTRKHFEAYFTAHVGGSEEYRSHTKTAMETVFERDPEFYLEQGWARLYSVASHEFPWQGGWEG